MLSFLCNYLRGTIYLFFFETNIVQGIVSMFITLSSYIYFNISFL
jgi:hypothetical protein